MNYKKKGKKWSTFKIKTKSLLNKSLILKMKVLVQKTVKLVKINLEKVAVITVKMKLIVKILMKYGKLKQKENKR